MVCQSHETTKQKSSTWGITHFWYSMHWTAIRLIRKVIILFLATLIHLVWREHDPGSVSGGPPSLSALHHYIYEGSSLQALGVFFFAATWSWKAEITLSLHFKGFPSSGEVGPVTGSLMGRRPLVDFNCTWRVDAGQQIYHRLEEVLRHLASEWIEETKHERLLWAETVWVSVSQLETCLCFRLLLDIRFTQSGWFNFTFSHQQRAAEDRRHTGSWWTLSLCELLVELFTKEMFHLAYHVYEKVVSTTNVWRTGALLPQTERLFCHFKKFKRSETNTAVLAS